MSTAIVISLLAVAVSLGAVFVAVKTGNTKKPDKREGSGPSTAASSDGSSADCSPGDGGGCDGGGGGD
jgi:hypothetical protein